MSEFTRADLTDGKMVTQIMRMIDMYIDAGGHTSLYIHLYPRHWGMVDRSLTKGTEGEKALCNSRYRGRQLLPSTGD